MNELSYEECMLLNLEPIDVESGQSDIDKAPFVPSDTNEREMQDARKLLSIQTMGLKKTSGAY